VLATTTDLAALNASSLHFLGLANAMRRQGLDVAIIAPRPSGPLTAALDNGVTATFTAAPRGVPRAAAIPFMVPALRQLRSRENLYVRSGIGTVALVRAARFAGFRRVVVEANGWFADDLAVLDKSKRWQSVARRLQIAEANAADAIRVVTAGLGRLFEADGVASAKLHPIANGTDLDVFRPGDRQAARRVLGIAPDAMVLAFVGNLWPAIDLPVLFAAAALAAPTVPKLEIVIVGDGVSRSTFEAAAERLLPAGVPCHWLGARQPAEANAVIAAADVCAAPFVAVRNQRIGLSPLKLYDYAAAGRMVVATDLPGIGDWRGEPWLHLAKPHDAAAFAAAIRAALASDRSAVEVAARACASAHFGWETVAARVAALF
jgi:glycosyltransferase involved in cell wall biosynthesis